MARKSRRESNCEIREVVVQETPVKERIATAIYARLSCENNGREDEESITSQLTLLRNYIHNNPQFNLVDTYVDNGFSGTDFNRPEFNRLMTDLNCGRISCVIVKDLSRFGRNYIETGMYIETIFPKLDVRLIALNDNFDSSDESCRDSISVPMKNMINEMYARDQSHKSIIANRIRSHKENVLPNGTAPVGYVKNMTATKYLVDSEKADYIKMIFLWKELGLSCKSIAERLNLIGAPLPGPDITSRKCDWWTGGSVSMIINNPVYQGNLYFGKTLQKMNGSGRTNREQPQSKWVIHEDTHEPLVTKYDYEKMREAIRVYAPVKGKKSHRDHSADNIRTLVYCKECDRRMKCIDSYSSSYSKKQFIRYSCISDMRHPKNCSKSASQDLIKIIVMDCIRFQLKLLIDRAELIKAARTAGSGKDFFLSIDRKINYTKSALADEKEKHALIYEDYRTGFIDREDFDLINENSMSRIRTLEETLESLGRKKDELTRAINKYLSMIDELEISANDEGYDDVIVGKLVERIDVTADNRIEVTFKTNDYIKLIDEALKGEK